MKTIKKPASFIIAVAMVLSLALTTITAPVALAADDTHNMLSYVKSDQSGTSLYSEKKLYRDEKLCIPEGTQKESTHREAAQKESAHREAVPTSTEKGRMLDLASDEYINKLERFDKPAHDDETPIIEGTFESQTPSADDVYATAEGFAMNAIDITSDFKDWIFLDAVRRILGKAADEPIYDTDVSGITSLRVTNSGIQDLAGLEHFILLEELYCNGNQLTELPTLPPGLTLLYCYNNLLTSLPTTLPSNLERLYCDDNLLSILPETLPNSLTWMSCDYNYLKALPDVLPPALTTLYCSGNQLTTLPTLPSGLIYLYCYSNQLTVLPTLPSGLVDFYCYYNQITELPTLPSGLRYLDCYSNQLTVLPTLPESLYSLDCSNNQLTMLNVSSLFMLGYLSCRHNQLTELALSSTAPYWYIDVSYNFMEGQAAVTGKQITWDGDYFTFYPQYANAIDITQDFTDPNFLAAVRYFLGKASSERIYDTDVAWLTWLSVTNKGITSLAGLEHFTSLTELYCYYNQITELPALPPDLEYLDCDGNLLTTLPTLPQNLEWLDCASNQLQALPALPSGLRYLRCANNQLTMLNVSGLSILEYLDCRRNQLTGLALSSTAPYWYINVSYNYMASEAAVTGRQITWDGDYFTFYPQYANAIDITSDFTDPNFLAAVRDFLGKAPDGRIYDIDVSWLTWLDVSWWHIASLAGLEHFTSLTELDCYGNQLTTLPALPSGLKYLYCSSNQLKELPTLPLGLKDLFCYYNQITELPTLPPDLRYLDCDGNLLTTLPTLPQNLEWLDCASNQLQALPALPSGLRYLRCANNQLTMLNVSGLSILEDLDCRRNQLTGLALSSTAPYWYIDVSYNYMASEAAVTGRQITWDGDYFTFYPQYANAIDITQDFTDPNFLAAVRDFLGKAPSERIYDTDVAWLTWLNVAYSGIVSLAGLEHFTSLTELYCYYNQITELPTLPSGLRYLLCAGNQLTALPTLPSGLEYLDCNGNLLTGIDLAGLSNLYGLWCFGNYMSSPDSVIGWRELGLVINSPEDPWGGNFLFYPQLEPPISWTTVGIHAPNTSYINNDVEFTISLANAVNVLDVELAFEFDGSVLACKSLGGLNGFDTIGAVLWTRLGDNTWRGELTVGHRPGEDSEGFTSKGPVDIANIVFAPVMESEATVALTRVRVVGKDGTEVVDLAAIVEPSAATTAIEQVYSKYDLNRDGMIEALDLGIMLLYCGFVKDDPRWSTYVKVNDTKGVGVTPSMCDVNSDGRVDMLDLLDLFIHYRT